jgi:hypothetical protein
MVSIHKQLGFVSETLYLAVHILDRFLSNKKVNLNDFQLLGATCFLIATKYEEKRTPVVDALCFFADGLYTANDLKRKEIEILFALNFELGWPSPVSFLSQLFLELGVASAHFVSIANYAMEMCLLDDMFIGIVPSAIASACYLFGLNIVGEGQWVILF